MRCSVPSPNQITSDTPLQLEVASAPSFPDDSMTATRLRRKGARGRLVIGLQEGCRQRHYGRQRGGRSIVAPESLGKPSGHSRGAMANAFGVP
jgi:hypothetical protein